MNTVNDQLKNIPGIDKILHLDKTQSLIEEHGQKIVVYCARQVVSDLRKRALNGQKVPSLLKIIQEIEFVVNRLKSNHLVPVINATGIIVHTNLGRAPLGESVISDSLDCLKMYNNLEFDLKTGKRGSRYDHLTDLLKYLTGAEDVLVVNNNAAAIMLILRTFAKGQEVVVSRGELIEIGGSFRMPDIMAASDCKMIEVGTTNKTHVKDFENAINENTNILLKVHPSNYVIKGFTKEVSLKEMVELGKRKNIPVVYDMGSGLLQKINIPAFDDEPDVAETLSTGVDLICFSGDKLLGGSQAGIIVGKHKLIEKLKKEPMTRALRIGKTTIALLETACQNYLDDEKLYKNNLVFQMASQKKEHLQNKAVKLKQELSKYDVQAEVIKSEGQSGGGSLPGEAIESFAVRLLPLTKNNKENAEYAEKMYYALLHTEQPLLGILKQGTILFDVLTLDLKDIELVASLIDTANKKIVQ